MLPSPQRPGARPPGPAGLTLLAALLLLTTGCPGGAKPDDFFDAAPPSCGPENCSGCCIGTRCVAGIVDEECGQNGTYCVDCVKLNQQCDPGAAICVPHCDRSCSGKCAGAADGCGGLCQVNDCEGCCLEDQCVAGDSTEACGLTGSQCSDCSQSGSGCVGGQCSNCTPDCDGKCAGASDGCGGSCGTSKCNGCCQGTSCVGGSKDEACGKQGAQCADCTTSGASCTLGQCSNCTPDCSGKCTGASDGCGGTCSANTCSGCCDAAQCLPGTSDTVCGKNGETCAVCPSDYLGYSWTCENKTCVKDTAVGGVCAGKTGGTTSCTDGGESGKCWESSCCTGCYDVALSLCRKVTNLNDSSCGDGGASCKDCSATGKVCSSAGLCTSPAGPCDGKYGGTTSCTDGGDSGKCWASSCCTGCYDTSSTLCREVTNLQDANCGDGGVACVDCTSSGKTCSSSGSCIASQPCGGSCKAYEYCSSVSNTCKISSVSKWRLKVVDGFVDCTSKDWDILGGKPDPRVEIQWSSSTSACDSALDYDWLSGIDWNTCNPVWNDVVTRVSGSTSYDWFYAYKLKTTFTVKLVEMDAVDVFMGCCQVSISDTNLKLGYKLIYTCKHPDDGVDYLTKLKFELTHVP